MNTVFSRLKHYTAYSALLFVTAFSPLVVTPTIVAAEGDTTEQPCVAPANDQNGVHYPIGADASTFTYQCEGPYAGQWTNPYYVYNPITTQRTALYDYDYSYDCSSGTWTMTYWSYSPASRTFVQSRIVPGTAPNLPTGCPPPPAPTANTGASSGAQSQSGDTPEQAAISNTGSGSSNSTNGAVTLNGNATNNTGMTMSNGLYSQANTGGAFIIGNTTGGSAMSGDAQSIANIANVLQSSTNAFGPGTAIFTANINGDVNGDFMFDPNAVIANTGPGSSNAANNTLQVNTNNTNNTNAQIANDINVGADSGDTAVVNNTTGGNATSGDAQAIVNLMNLINSTVSSGQSFVGTININGNLNGDILLPQNLIDQLIASSGPGSSNTATTDLTSNSQITNNTDLGIANNITTGAQSGNATVANNTTGGSATSGNAQTNVTILNLTGSNTIGKNNILVFVNVLGQWVGMIMNAPSGSTAASLGGGILNTGPGSQNTTNTTGVVNANMTNNTDLGIINNVNAHATSGDASVTGNTTGGNATSGDAMTAVNILNMVGSNLNLSDWFGVLFINVFGNWTGSFGVNTAAGDPIATPAVATTTSGGAGGNAPAPEAAFPAATFASFIPRNTALVGTSTGSVAETASKPASAVLASSVLGAQTTEQAAKAGPTVGNKSHADYTLPAIGITIATLMLVGERIVTVRKAHKAAQ